MDIYEAIEDYLSQGRRGTLATIVRKLGAAPREEGAKMFIGDDGRFFGTVGGGCVEAEVWQAAKAVAKTEKVRVLSYRMNGTLVEDEGMICGGNVDIFLEPLFDRYRALYSTIRGLEKRGEEGVVVTEYGEGLFRKSLVMADGSVMGDDLDARRVEELRASAGKKGLIVADGTLVEPIVTSSVLYLFGAGHVSQYVSRVASMVDFNVVIIDDRADFANRERFPEADEIIVEDFHKVFENLTFSGKEYVAILTRGHKYDADVLEEVMKRPARYVGMIGSPRKTNVIMRHLEAKGFERAALQAVHSPIGLEIEAETPQEIAVAIVAELIAIKRRP